MLTLTQLHEICYSPLHRYANRLTRSPERADDLVQEVFLCAMSHLEMLGQLREPQRLAWLKRVLKNRFLDEQRKLRRQQRLEEFLALQIEQRQRAWQTSHPLWRILVEELFDQIPERDRELLHQHYALGMTSQEIADLSGIPAATVRSRIHLALKKLRAKPSRLL